MSFDLGIKHLLVCEAAALLGNLLITWPCLMIRLVSPDSLRLVNSGRSCLLFSLSCGVKSGAVFNLLAICDPLSENLQFLHIPQIHSRVIKE